MTDNTPVSISDRAGAIKFREERIYHLLEEIKRMEDQVEILEHERKQLLIPK